MARHQNRATPRNIDYGDCYSRLSELGCEGLLPISLSENSVEQIRRGTFPTEIDRLFFQLFELPFEEKWFNAGRNHMSEAYDIVGSLLQTMPQEKLAWLWSPHAPTLIRAKMLQMGLL